MEHAPARVPRRRRLPVSTAGGLGSLLLLQRVRLRNKRKAATPQPHSGEKKRRGGDNAARKAVTLEEIRGLPPSATRPFYPRILHRGASSIKQPKPWTCLACGSDNGLTHHLLFDLPAFNCNKCGADPPEDAADFGFCYADLGMNGVCPIGNVNDQKGETCVANALSSSVEISHRIMMVVLDEPVTKEGPLIDVEDLLEKYRKRSGAKGQSSCPPKYTLRSMVSMLEVFVDEGVIELERSEHKISSNDSGKVFKISDWGCIPQDDFISISSALSDGYPLVTGFQCGKRIDTLKHGELYMPPKRGSTSNDGKRKPEGHVAVLVGAQQEKQARFFYFLNSWDEDFCRRSYDEGDGIRGGVGAIMAEGLDFPPIQVLRFNEKEKQAVQHSA